jgi:hypothetical protein
MRHGCRQLGCQMAPILARASLSEKMTFQAVTGTDRKNLQGPADHDDL